MNSFTRGGDVKKTIGIGRIEGLKNRIENLMKEKPIKKMETTKIGKNRVLIIELDLIDTEYTSPDAYLISFLQPEWFSYVTAERTNYYITGISENLADLRNDKTREFSVTMYIRDEYVEEFPMVHHMA